MIGFLLKRHITIIMSMCLLLPKLVKAKYKEGSDSILRKCTLIDASIQVYKEKGAFYIAPKDRKESIQVNFYYRKNDSVLIFCDDSLIYSTRVYEKENVVGVTFSIGVKIYNRKKSKIVVLLLEKGEYIVFAPKRKYVCVTVRPSIKKNESWYLGYSNNLPYE